MKISFLIICIFSFSLISIAQQTKTITIKTGEAFDIPEVGAIITKNKVDIAVRALLPAPNRAKEYENIDLQEKDKVLMANGKKINDIKELEAIYNNLKIGEDFKLGIKRGEEMRIVTIKKADPKNLPERKVIIKHKPDKEH